MWMTILGFLGGPVIKAMIDAYKAKLAAGTSDKITAAKTAGEEIGAQQAELASIYSLRIAQIGHPWEPEKLAIYITLVYYAKLLIWDKVLGIGVTDPLAGWALLTSNLIIGFYFSKRTAENVTTIIKAFK
jgi:hypothetical protein